MSTEIKLKVSEIQRFCMHDGPGVRTTVFLQGCPLNCAWCHNPEMRGMRPELLFYGNKCIGCGACYIACKNGVHSQMTHGIDREKCTLCGTCTALCPAGALEISAGEMSISEILAAVERDRAFYGERGGVTLSGGEPLACGERAIALLAALKESGFSTAVETCGYISPEILRAAAPLTDIFLYDVKDTSSARHERYVGVKNDLILENLFLLSSLGARIRLRCILVKGVNTEKSHYLALARLGQQLCPEGIELIPYHAYGGSKATFLGKEDNGKSEWIPEEADIEEAREILRDAGIRPFG